MENNIKINKDFEKYWVQNLLRTGLGLAAVLMFVGILYKAFTHDLAATPFSFMELFNQASNLGDKIIAWGVFILALTPMMRVFLLLTIWIKEKDWKFVSIAIVVLITLAISMFLGGE